MEEVRKQIEQFNGVPLSDLDSVALLNRIDTKYTLHISQLHQILPLLQESYFVLEIDGLRIFNYENNYFDTKDFQFFRDHHNGYAHRLKVRCRNYVESNLSFFEIKKKEKINRTNKHRVVINQMQDELSESQQDIVQNMSRKSLKNLELILKNNFNRITLVNKSFTERVTIDLNIEFKDKDNCASLHDLVILEVKNCKSNLKSDIKELLNAKKIKPKSFSKYIYGIIRLHPQIKKNNFRPLIKSLTNFH